MRNRAVGSREKLRGESCTERKRRERRSGKSRVVGRREIKPRKSQSKQINAKQGR